MIFGKIPQNYHKFASNLIPPKWVPFSWPLQKRVNQTIPFPQALTAQKGEFFVLHMTHIFRAGTTWRGQHLDEMQQNVGSWWRKGSKWTKRFGTLLLKFTLKYTLALQVWEVCDWSCCIGKKMEKNLSGRSTPSLSAELRNTTPQKLSRAALSDGFIFQKKWLDWCIYRKSITGRLPWLTIFASKGWDTWL